MATGAVRLTALGGAPVLWIFKSQMLLAAVERHLTRPLISVPRQNLLNRCIVTRAVEHRRALATHERFGGNHTQIPVRGLEHTRHGIDQSHTPRPPVDLDLDTTTLTLKNLLWRGQALTAFVATALRSRISFWRYGVQPRAKGQTTG